MSEWDRRRNNFDFMRLSLAVLVIYSHAFIMGTGTEMAEPITRFTHVQMNGGKIAVDSFFIMSGFLIAASAERSRGMGSFLKKRVARIYPAFVVAMVFGLVAVLPFSGGHLFYDGVGMRVGNFLLQTLRLREFSYADVFMKNPVYDTINGSTWSVQYEFFCYLGLAAMAGVGLLRRRGVVLGLFAAAMVVNLLFRWRGWMFGGKLLGVIFGPPQIWAMLLPLYLAGVVFYLFRERIPLRWWLALGSATILLASCRSMLWMTLCFPIAGTYLLFWFAFTPWVKLHGFGRFGDFSYGTYLYAFPIEQLVVERMGAPADPWVIFVRTLPLTLVAAVASWYGVERWFLAPGRRKETVVHALVQEKLELES